MAESMRSVKMKMEVARYTEQVHDGGVEHDSVIQQQRKLKNSLKLRLKLKLFYNLN